MSLNTFILLSIFLFNKSKPVHSIEVDEHQYTLPVIDLSKFIDQDLDSQIEVAKLWDVALSNFGFVAITNHQISELKQNNLFDKSSIFFKQSLDTKLEQQSSKTYGLGGYTHMGVESVGRTMEDSDSELPFDLVENFAFLPESLNKTIQYSERGKIKMIDFEMEKDRNKGSVLDELKLAASIYWDEVETLLNTLHALSSLSLDLKDQDYFNKYYYPNPSHALRLAYYPPITSITSPDCDNKDDDDIGNQCINPPEIKGVRYGAHTDYLGFTILRPDRHQSGLEVLFPDGKWHDIHNELLLNSDASDALIINVGDLLSRWTNNKWKSAVDTHI